MSASQPAPALRALHQLADCLPSSDASARPPHLLFPQRPSRLCLPPTASCSARAGMFQNILIGGVISDAVQLAAVRRSMEQIRGMLAQVCSGCSCRSTGEGFRCCAARVATAGVVWWLRHAPGGGAIGALWLACRPGHCATPPASACLHLHQQLGAASACRSRPACPGRNRTWAPTSSGRRHFVRRCASQPLRVACCRCVHADSALPRLSMMRPGAHAV